MTAEQVSALAAVLAVGISVGAFVVTWMRQTRDEEARKAWELDQDTKRQGWAKDLQDRQHVWQVAREQERREWEEQMRQQAAAPRIAVLIYPALHPYEESAEVQVLVMSEAKNVGQVPVYFSSWGEFVLPDGKLLAHGKQPNPRLYGPRDHFGRALEPGNSVSYYWEREYVLRALVNNGYRKDTPIRALFIDRLGNRFESESFVVPEPSEAVEAKLADTANGSASTDDALQ